MASKLLALLTVLFALSGCLNNSAYRALDSSPPSRSRPASTAVPEQASRPVSTAAADRPGQYRVRRGDTLYSIAFRYGLDYKKLANANNIGPDYTILVGQTLVLREAQRGPATAARPQSQASPPERVEPAVTKNNSQNNDVDEIVSNAPSSSSLDWIWPHDGNIVRTFNPNVSDRKGVDITGEIGDSVKAAAGGTVVYAGNGLPGYGNLIILEHNSSLLSAYAFNQELLVSERDQVRKGQVIARLGKQGDQPRLHFEIRREGKPVDPMGYLPGR